MAGLAPLAPGLRALDLGSGGGVPGLPLAVDTYEWNWSLLEGGATRAAFLKTAVEELGLTDRVDVIARRAEEAGRDPAVRGQYDRVVARGFSGPAVTAECAAPLLRVGGILVVTEPPGGSPERWDQAGLAKLGLRPERTVARPTAMQILVQEDRCPDRFPRRVGIPAKRPLF